MKKINSDISFENSDFKIKVGTVDKKNPTALYLNIGTYVTPIDKTINFKSEIESLKKTITKDVGEIVEKSSILQNQHIFVTDIAVDRLAFGKKSYLEFNLYVKPELFAIKACNNNFHNVAKLFYDNSINNIVQDVSEKIKKCGFSYTKAKK